MFALNRAELIGRLGRPPEMRYTAEGQAVTRFSLATDRPVRAGGKPEVDWHSVVCWGKLAEFGNQYLTKGRLVFVAGRIAYRSWEGKDGLKHRTTEIVASELILLDRRPEGDQPQSDDESAGDVPF